VYRRILGPAYDYETCRILTNNEIYAIAKKNPTITETIRLHRLYWFGHVDRMERKQNSQNSIGHEFRKKKIE
jgi:hypothetical protein